MPTPVDLRSDTITRPTPAMRQAILEAEVGDDVYGEDPTVNALEKLAAEVLGKEEALFVPSGTMANQLALLVHTHVGSEIIAEQGCHIFNHEGAAGAWLSSTQVHPLTGTKGILTADQIAEMLRPGGYGEPATSLITIENTHNFAGGRVQPLDVLQDIRKLALDQGLPMHMDGARLWNASAASGIAEKDYAACFDTVSVCLSKGLGAPVGSMLAGTHAAIKKARYFRGRLGGNLRQSGILAAAGIYAINNHRSRLKEDHQKAKALAKTLSTSPVFSVDPEEIETNIIFFKVANNAADKAVEIFKQHGIFMLATEPDTIRMITHLDISADDITRTQEVISTHFSNTNLA